MTKPVAAWRVTYTPGTWLVLTGPTALVVMPPAPARASGLVNTLWADIVQAGSADALLQLVANLGLDSVPDFGAFFADDAGLHGLARGRVRVIDADTGETALDGDGSVTWREEHLGTERRLRIDLEEINPDEALQLPLVVGAAAVSAIQLTTAEDQLVRFPSAGDTAPAPAPVAVADEQPVREQHPDEQQDVSQPGQAEEAGVGEAPAPDQPAEGAAAESDETPADDAERELEAPVETAPIAPQPEPVEAAPKQSAEPRPVDEPDPSAAVPMPAEESEPDPAPEQDPQPEPEPAELHSEPAPQPEEEFPVQPLPPLDFSDDEPEAAPLTAASPVAAPFGAVSPVPPPAPPIGATAPPVAPGLAPAPAIGEPSSLSSPSARRETPVVIPPKFDDVDDDDGGTIFSTGLAATHKPAAPEDRQDPQVLAVPCVNGHANAPGSRHCRLCRGPVDSANPRLIRRPILAGVHTNQGDFVDVVAGVVVGRAPDAANGPAGAHLMRVPSPSNDISRNHVLITTREWNVHVTDLYSTNGTTVLPVGEAPFTLRDGASVHVELGTVLDLGDGVSLRIEPPRS